MVLVPVEIGRLMLSETQDAPTMVVLREIDGERALPILIGFFEALSINRELTGQPSPRPLTHDLLGNVIDGLGATIKRIIVSDLVDSTFIGIIELEKEDGTVIEIDSRPSDAIALSTRAKCPIFIDSKVFEKMSSDDTIV